MNGVKRLLKRIDGWIEAHRLARVSKRAVSGFLAHEALQYAGSHGLLRRALDLPAARAARGRRVVRPRRGRGAPAGRRERDRRVAARRRDGGRDHRLGHRVARRDDDHQLRLPAVERARDLLGAVDRHRPRLREQHAARVRRRQAPRTDAHGPHRPARGRVDRHRDRYRHPAVGRRRASSATCPADRPRCGGSASSRRSC